MISDIKNYNKFQITITLIILLSFCITGATYAYFAVSATEHNTITGDAATVNLTLSVSKVFPTASSENTGVMVPQLSTSGSSTSPLSTALKSGCVDGNGNIVCQVYEIIIENIGGTATQIVDGSVSFYSNPEQTTDISTEMPNLKWKLISSVDKNTPTNSVLGTNSDLSANFNENIFANDVKMVTNSIFPYYMIIWINETTQDQPTDEGKTFYGKIEFNSSNGTGITSMFNSHVSAS